MKLKWLETTYGIFPKNKLIIDKRNNKLCQHFWLIITIIKETRKGERKFYSLICYLLLISLWIDTLWQPFPWKMTPEILWNITKWHFLSSEVNLISLDMFFFCYCCKTILKWINHSAVNCRRNNNIIRCWKLIFFFFLYYWRSFISFNKLTCIRFMS